MRAVIIEARCDRCNGEVKEGSDGFGVLVALDIHRPVRADLCADCLELAHDALDAAIRSGTNSAKANKNGNGNGAGRRGGTGAYERERVQCPICGKIVAKGSGQVIHARRIHNLERDQVWQPELV